MTLNGVMAVTLRYSTEFGKSALQKRSVAQFMQESIHFYSTSALLAMQSAVLARGIPFVCLSVTFRYCVQVNKDTIVRFSASGRTISLVSGEVKFIRIFVGDHPQRGR